jgi:dolichol-phosphate mannosyltransferase
MNRLGRDPSTDIAGRVPLSVIAPCLNEESNIDVLADRTLAVFDQMNIPAELVLIDDGSTDGTWRKITNRLEPGGRVRAVRHPSNRGMEAAWRSGVAEATGELTCLIDADLQNRPEDIPLLYDAFQRGSGDIIQAVRHPVQGLRRLYLFSRVLNFVLNLVFGMKSRDNKSGFILCRREALARVLDHKYDYRYFQNLLGAAASARGYRIGEVDTVFDRRHAGESFLSRLPFLVSARTCWEIVKFRYETWADRGRYATTQREGWVTTAALPTASSGES